MVNPKPHKVNQAYGLGPKTLWYCGKCDSLYDYREHAKECCTPKSPFRDDGLPRGIWRV